MLQGFRQFMMRGNVIDLAVGVVIGLAFSAIVTAVLDGLINPLIAAIFGKADLTAVGRFEINNSVFSIGLILDAIFNLITVAAAIYFFVVLPINKLTELRKRGQEPAAEEVPEDLAVLKEIRDLLSRESRQS